MNDEHTRRAVFEALDFLHGNFIVPDGTTPLDLAEKIVACEPDLSCHRAHRIVHYVEDWLTRPNA